MQTFPNLEDSEQSSLNEIYSSCNI